MLHERLDAISSSRVDGRSKLVLIMLAKRLDRDDPEGVVWSSSATLAAECGVGVNAITRTMDRLTKAGIIRIVSKAAQGRSARKAIDWTALAAAERDSGPVQNFENHRSGEPRITTAVNLESPERGTLNHHGEDSRITAPVTDPIREPDQESDHPSGHQPITARDDEPSNESDPMPTDHRGSRPTMDSDPIDNDGEDTSPPFRAAPSPLTDPERPATSETSATPDQGTAWSLHPQADAAPPPAKPKRKAKATTALDLEAWGKCCQAWDGMTGRTRAWRPEAGDGKTIAAAMLEQGTAKVAARFDQAARDAWCCGAARDSSRPLSVFALTRAKTALTSRLDAAAEQATLDAESRSEAVAASVGMLTHPSAQNAPERQPAPKQTGSAAWDDMLTTIRGTGGLRLSVGLRGSTLSHDAGEHKRRCQAVADIGGWAKLCEMGEGNRGIIRAQFVAAYDRAGVSA